MSKTYIHDKNLKYPDKDYAHMVISEKTHDYTYDENFMYRLKGFKYKFLRLMFKIAMIVLVQPVCRIRYCLKIKGKRNFREYGKLAKKKGMITICNHTTQWDTIFISAARYFHFAEFPSWQEGIESKSGMLYRVAGGIAMPTHSMRGTFYGYKAMKNVLDEGKWLHIFPEAACWHFYPAIRPFQKGAFKLAYETDMPVLPMAVTYRKPRGIYKLFKKHPNAMLSIGKPLQTNKCLSKNEAIDDLAARCHLAVANLAGIESEEENRKIIESLPTYHVE